MKKLFDNLTMFFNFSKCRDEEEEKIVIQVEEEKDGK